MNKAKKYMQDYVVDQRTGDIVPNVNKVNDVQDLRISFKLDWIAC